MKFFYVLANQFVTVLLSANTVTNLHFQKEISYCDIGVSKQVAEIVYRRNNMTVAIIPKSEQIKSNMTCYTKDWKIYVFNISWSEKNGHKDIVINDAGSSRGGQKIFENETVKIFDSGKNYYIENKTDDNIIVNESVIKKAGVISKWSPIILNNKEIEI